MSPGYVIIHVDLGLYSTTALWSLLNTAGVSPAKELNNYGYDPDLYHTSILKWELNRPSVQFPVGVVETET